MIPRGTGLEYRTAASSSRSCKGQDQTQLQSDLGGNFKLLDVDHNDNPHTFLKIPGTKQKGTKPDVRPEWA